MLKLLENVLVQFFVQAAEHLLLSQTRGVFDNQMAGLANNFKINCPECKAVECWKPAPEDEQVVVKQKDNNAAV
jgi:hypothetical protein